MYAFVITVTWTYKKKYFIHVLSFGKNGMHNKGMNEIMGKTHRTDTTVLCKL